MTIDMDHLAIVPDWPAPPLVRACSTMRRGGFGRGSFASFNLGTHVGDDPLDVAANRALLLALLPSAPCWLTQEHGIQVVDASKSTLGTRADASYSRRPGVVCVVQTADCLPLLLCDRDGSVVAAVHAGWRGLAAGIIEATLRTLAVPGCEILAWLGPAIGPRAFEVGADVRSAFIGHDSEAADAFVASPLKQDKWFADLYALARGRLAGCGVTAVYGGDRCTFSEPDCFFSHRRDRRSGRMASLIWLEKR